MTLTVRAFFSAPVGITTSVLCLCADVQIAPLSLLFGDATDSELIDMIGVLADLADVDDVRSVLDGIIDQ